MDQVPSPKVTDNLTLYEIVKPRLALPNRTFYRGRFDAKLQLKVFVRRIERKASAEKEAEKEVERDKIAYLLIGAQHENIIRYFPDQFDSNFYYYLTEECVCSVEDLYLLVNKNEDKTKETNHDEILKYLSSKDILHQTTKGLVFLHSFNFVHRNIKPSNVLIAQDKRNPKKYVVKLSDFRTAKNLLDENEQEHSGPKGSDGWIAPYPKTNGANKIQTNPKEDVFILGCLFYYVLDPEHRHPFGKSHHERRTNIIDKENYEVNWEPIKTNSKNQAIILIKDMIQYESEKRPDLKTILDRAYFLPDDYYKLYDVPDQKPGFCVIFNQEKFSKAAHNREGSNKDKEALKKIFEEFGFEVDHHDNLTADEIKKQIKKLATKDYTMYGCVVVSILSHGNEGTICTYDGSTVSIEETKKEFYGNSSLKDKPKIWIIQACQGNQLQEDFEIKEIIETREEDQSENTTLADDDPEITGSNPYNSDTDDDATHTSALPAYRPTRIQSPLPDIPRPPVSDFIDIRATVPGCVSFRNLKTGSLLIRKLCEQMRQAFLDDEKYNRHLEDVLKKVQKEISCDIRWLLVNKDDRKIMEDWRKRFPSRPIKWEKATHIDIQKNSNIKSGFVKTYDTTTKKWIFERPCQQTIEWRSTLMDFIRFEKSKIDPSPNHQVPSPKRFKRFHP